MEITLRKAAAMQQELQNQFNDEMTKIVTCVELTEFKEPKSVLDSTRQESLDRIAECERLVNAIYELRDLIGKENASSGVSEILAKIAQTNKLIALYDDVVSNKTREDMEVIEGKLNKIARSEETMYASKVVSHVMLEDDMLMLRKRIKELKKIKSQLSDRLLEINVSTKIKVSSTTEQVLQDTGLA